MDRCKIAPLFLLLACLGLVPLAFASDSSPRALQEAIQQHYQNHSFNLRYCGESDSQQYDADGKPPSVVPQGSWTLLSRVEITKMVVTPVQLQIEGRRMAFKYDWNQSKLVSFNRETPVKMEVALRQPVKTPAELHEIFGRVFALTRDDFISAMPELWRSYVSSHLAGYSEDGLEIDFKPDLETQAQLRRSTQLAGQMSEAPWFEPTTKKPKCTPQYPGEAVAGPGGIDLRLVINESGRVEKTEIIRPLGLGIDECVVMDLETWSLQPSTTHSAAPGKSYFIAHVQFAPDATPAFAVTITPEPPPDLLGHSSSPGVRSAPQPAPPGQDPIFHVGADVSPPRAAWTPQPELTEEARKAGVKATVVLNIVVGRDGRVGRIKVVRSAGMGLDESTIDTVKTWRFQPAIRDGQPVAVEINVEVVLEPH